MERLFQQRAFAFNSNTRMNGSRSCQHIAYNSAAVRLMLNGIHWLYRFREKVLLLYVTKERHNSSIHSQYDQGLYVTL